MNRRLPDCRRIYGNARAVTLIASLFISLFYVSAAQVSFSLRAGPPKNGKFSAQLAAEIDQGWHIASLAKRDQGPLPTEISLVAGEPFEFSGDIVAPDPHKKHSAAFGFEIETYTGTVVFTLPLATTEGLKAGTKLTVDITYQACNEETCLLPKTEKVSCIIGEARPGQGKASSNEPQVNKQQ